MKKRYAVFSLEKERRIYSGDEYFYCGDLLTICDSKVNAEIYIKDKCSLLLVNGGLITIIKVYSK